MVALLRFASSHFSLSFFRSLSIESSTLISTIENNERVRRNNYTSIVIENLCRFFFISAIEKQFSNDKNNLCEIS